MKLGTTAGANDKLELEFDYSPSAKNGNLLTQYIRQPGRTWRQDYTYDALNRIATASEQYGFSQTFGYDRYGNRCVTSTGITTYDPHEPTVCSLYNTANNRLANQTYDAAGNQLTYDPRTLAYDAENRMISAISSQNGKEYFVYDGDGRRVSKTWTPNGGSSQTTRYVYDLGAHVAAEYTSQVSTTTGTSWMFTDLLGSVRAVTGEKPRSGSASITECCDYLPFGRMLSSNDNGRNTGCYPTSPDFALSSVESPKFTGQVREAETGLDFFGARYMSGSQGRFVSPDTPLLAQHPAAPQSWNLYTYTANNPLSRIDPDCHNWFQINGVWSWHKGSDVNGEGEACKKGSEGCYHSDYTHLIIFQKTGPNNEGAQLGILTLYGNDGKEIMHSPAFSGGDGGKPSAGNATYKINLTRGLEKLTVADVLRNRTTGQYEGLAQNYGIQDLSILQNSGWGDYRVVHLRESLQFPKWRNITQVYRGSHIPWGVVFWNMVAMAIWTVGVFSALYAAYLRPDLRVTSSELSAIINGVATILMFMFIDPYLSMLTDEVAEGKVTEPYFRRSIVWLTGSRVVGTIAAQLLLIPAALSIVAIAEWL